MLDFDGTLVDIVAKSDLICVPPQVPLLLSKLREAGHHVYIVTGRWAHDVKTRLAPAQIPVIGLHGLDWNGAIESPRHESLDAIAAAIEPFAHDYPGFYFEDKKVILSFHFRTIEASSREVAKTQVRNILAGHLPRYDSPSPLVLIEGHENIEIKPSHTDKATAVVRLVSQHPSFHPIYIGDDQPDEDAMRALGNSALTIRVSLNEVATCAQFRMNSPAEVIAFLNNLSD